MNQENKQTKRVIFNVIKEFFVVLMCVYSLTLLFPILWMLIGAVKDPIDYYLTSSLTLPNSIRWSNFAEAIKAMTYTIDTPRGRLEFDIYWMIYYSLLYSIGTAVYSVITITFTAYAIGRYRFWLTKLLYSIGLTVMILPMVTDGGAGLLIKKALHIYDNMLLVILTSGGCIFTGQFFFIMCAHFKAMDKDYSDAASIDGAGEWTIMTKIMLPLSIPLMTVVFVLAFISAWNNYSVFLFYLPSYANLSLGIYNFQMVAPLKGYTPPHILAGFLIVAIPIIVLYAASQKVIAQNLTIGGLKG